MPKSNRYEKKAPSHIPMMDDLKDEDKALTSEDIVDRTTGDDFWNIYEVRRCSV